MFFTILQNIFLTFVNPLLQQMTILFKEQSILQHKLKKIQRRRKRKRINNKHAYGRNMYYGLHKSSLEIFKTYQDVQEKDKQENFNRRMKYFNILKKMCTQIVDKYHHSTDTYTNDQNS